MRPLSRWFVWLIFAVILAQFCARNLPWHLDNYDQAKQAYTSFEMTELGHWWFQHTPSQAIATKPPLAGWISAAIYELTRWWDGAWRFPSIVSALILLAIIAREGARILSSFGGALAAGAFGLNLLAPRIATLVRTDMLLTLFIFLAGWIVFKKVREGAKWEPRECWLIFWLILGSMMTKGPIAYAFLLPGLVAFSVICRRQRVPCNAWCGWWPWFLPLAFFLVWAGIGIWQSHEFYEQVVLKEFLGRFTVGERAVHKNQPVYFYVTHILRDWSPWSMLLIALLFLKDVRRGIARDPAALWLVCWSVGGIVFMSLVPSKRPDRIFPAIPPLCLLLVCAVREIQTTGFLKITSRQLAAVCLTLAMLISESYTVFNISQAYRKHVGALVNFGARVRLLASARQLRYAVAECKDEGMPLYLRIAKPTKFHDALAAMQSGQLDALVLPSQDFQNASASEFAAQSSFEMLDETGKVPEKNDRYFFIARKNKP